MKHVNFVPKDVQRILSSRKSIMNRKCSTRKLFLKISQYSQENTCVGISFLIKMQAFRAPALLKRDSNTGVFCEHWEIFKNTYFEEHLRTAASESFTWFFPALTNDRKWKRRFLKNKTKQKPFENPAIWKKTYLFMVLFIISFFSFSPLHVRPHLPYIIKDDTSESFETA